MDPDRMRDRCGPPCPTGAAWREVALPFFCLLCLHVTAEGLQRPGTHGAQACDEAGSEAGELGGWRDPHP